MEGASLLLAIATKNTTYLHLLKVSVEMADHAENHRKGEISKDGNNRTQMRFRELGSRQIWNKSRQIQTYFRKKI